MTYIAKHQLTFLRTSGEHLDLPGLEQFLNEHPERMEWQVRSSRAYLALNPHGATFQHCVALADLFEDHGLGGADVFVISLHELETEIHANGTLLIGLDADSILKTSDGWFLGMDRPVDDLETVVRIILDKRHATESQQ